MNRLLLLLLSFIIAGTASAQAIKDQYIVTLKENQVQRFEHILKRQLPDQSIGYRVLSKDIHVVELFSPAQSNKELENFLSNSHLVEHWGYNFKTEKRKEPNDQYFDMQWGLQLINAPAAWEVTTGGLDFFGQEITAMILDESFDLVHPELEGRIFTNTGEVPNDGIDNDNNGYVDDYQGYNTKDQNGSHPKIDEHGNAVMGIIGAKTDNDEGMAGINWDLKMVPVSGINSQAEVIAGYQYAIDLRRLFNETNGQEGAYIVVSNYSAGIDDRFGTEPQFKSWCDMYDAMADVGILSVGATANKDTNVDTQGDIPTTCPSEFLIAVTNVDESDTKVVKAGFGLTNIDIGAPGKGTLTLDIDDGYDQAFGGTSAATPHIAGAIALLYSVPCKAVAELAQTNPKEACILIRDAIYKGVEPNTSLAGITATGGRLDLLGAMEQLQESCAELQLPSPKGELEITKIAGPSESGIYSISYIVPDDEEYNIMVTDRIGRVVYRETFLPPSLGRRIKTLDLSNLVTGIYIISIYNESNIKSEKKFILE